MPFGLRPPRPPRPGASIAVWQLGMFSTDPMESAAEAGLRYVRNRGPCIRRVRCGRAFRYLRPDGKPLQDPKHLQRIRALVIPPAWTDVWICPNPNGHLQAVGRDAK